MEQIIMSGEQLLERRMQAQQDAVASIDKTASEHITAFYTPSRHEQMMRMSQSSGAVLPSRVVLLAQDGGREYSVKHGQDVLGSTRVSIDDIAKLTGGSDAIGRLQVHGVGHYPNAIRAVQHLKGLHAEIPSWDLMQAVQTDPSIVNKAKVDVVELVKKLAAPLPAENADDTPSMSRGRHH
jgi:hypothetical protein